MRASRENVEKRNVFLSLVRWDTKLSLKTMGWRCEQPSHKDPCRSLWRRIPPSSSCTFRALSIRSSAERCLITEFWQLDLQRITGL